MGFFLSCLSNFPRLAEMCNLQQQQLKADRVICVYGHAYKQTACHPCCLSIPSQQESQQIINKDQATQNGHLLNQSTNSYSTYNKHS